MAFNLIKLTLGRVKCFVGGCVRGVFDTSLEGKVDDAQVFGGFEIVDEKADSKLNRSFVLKDAELDSVREMVERRRDFVIVKGDEECLVVMQREVEISIHRCEGGCRFEIAGPNVSAVDTTMGIFSSAR